MGTVVFPDADLKVFLDADDDERARRRTAELVGQVPDDELAEVRAQMAERDRRDRGRALSPLTPAPDAVVIDSTGLGLAAVVDRIAAEVKRRRGGD